MSTITGPRLHLAVNELVAAFPTTELLKRFVRSSEFAEVVNDLVTASPVDAAHSLVTVLESRYGDERAPTMLVKAIEDQLPQRNR